MSTPFYDPLKSYEENYAEGPFGAFADGIKIESAEIPRYDLFGLEISSPFGIPAGPLVNSKFIKAAFEKGFDICVYKTVRAGVYPAHPYPNVVPVRIDGNLTPEIQAEGLKVKERFEQPLSITNSFGVPSRDPKFWKEDCNKAVSYAGRGQLVILSFMGTVHEGQTRVQFIEDHARVARLAKNTEAKVFEMNLSCPNVGNEGLICFDLDITEDICKAVRKELGDSPLILKVGYYESDKDLERLVDITSKYADGIAVINTMQAKIFNEDGSQALPGGPERLRSGVGGAAIKWAGLEMTRRLAKLREETKSNFKIIGGGGVMNPADFKEYMDAGADIVMSCTGAMWNPYLAKEIKETL